MPVKGKISEIFDSIQGEGLYLGEKQLFVRFFGCNLKCKYCDTKLHRYQEYEPEALLKELELRPGKYHSVSFTGGEPLLQHDFLKAALQLTASKGYKNYLETNGTLPHVLEDVLEYLDIVAMDLKLPSSTDQTACWDEHREFLRVASRKEVFIKAVICNSTHAQDLREGLKMIREVNPYAVLVLQPNSFEKDPAMVRKLERFKKMCMARGIVTCIIPQVHKMAKVR